MEKYRSQSCREGGMMEMKNTNGGFPNSMKDLRSNTTWKKPATLKNWRVSDPELQRKKRVAAYNVYSVETKMKGSFKKSLGWIKHTYTQLLYGHRKM